MAQTWQSVPVPEVSPGDRIKYRDTEFTVARIDAPFLGRAEMVCLIEDEPTRWHAYPAPIAMSVEVLRD